MNIPEYEIYHEHKNHSDSLFPYNTYICSIPLDFNEVTPHWHNEMEIIYIKKGKGTISLDMDMMYVEAGDIIVVIPGQLHGITQLENYSMEYENIIFHPTCSFPNIRTLWNPRFLYRLCPECYLLTTLSPLRTIFMDLLLVVLTGQIISARHFRKATSLRLKDIFLNFLHYI